MIGALAVAMFLAGPAVHGPAIIHWESNFDEALKKARGARKPVMIDFWAQWCDWCHRLDETTYADPEVVRLAGDFVAVKVNTEDGPGDVSVATRYAVSLLPTIAFVTPHGRLILRIESFQGPGQFPITQRAAKDAAARVMVWEATLERNPSDAEALADLGYHLFDQDSHQEARDLLERARKADANRPAPARKRTRLVLAIIHTHERRFAKAEALLKEALAIGTDVEYDAKTLYVLGRNYLRWGKRDEARSVLEAVVEQYADRPVAQRARELLAALDQPP